MCSVRCQVSRRIRPTSRQSETALNDRVFHFPQAQGPHTVPDIRPTRINPFNGHIKTEKQRTIIQQYGDWYTGLWWVGCYIWYSEKGTKRAAAPPSPLLAVPNVTAHPSTASVLTSCYSMWHYNYPCTLKR